MARPIRVQFEGAVYHVTARGNERRLIFRRDQDRETFLRTLAETAEEQGLLVHAYCLMPNHYHLVVETPRGNLSRAIGWLQTTYTVRFNRRHRRSGHLFQGRFKAHLIEADNYSRELLRYLHLNPVRPRDKSQKIDPQKRADFAAYPWSSHRAYCGAEPTPAWLSTDWLSFFAPGRKAAQRQYRKFVDDAFEHGVDDPWAQLQRGLVLGGEKLLERVERYLEGQSGQEEVRWVARTEETPERISAAQSLADQQADRVWQVWVRVCLGGERRIDVARAYAYKDGSAVTQILKRLEAKSAAQPAIAQQMAELRRLFSSDVSSVKS
jgi:putative transposase